MMKQALVALFLAQLIPRQPVGAGSPEAARAP